MAFTLTQFIRLRPHLYHVTERSNLPRLARSHLMEPAAELIQRSGCHEWLQRRRSHAVPLKIDGETIVLKDQRPLVLANAALTGGWAHEDFVSYLNQHVFFWPGAAAGPIRHGARLLARYEETGPAILRMRTQDVLEANSQGTPLFSPFNSGALRKQNGFPVARGPYLFAPAHQFPRTAGDVVEVAFRSAVHIPATTCVATSAGVWAPLADVQTERTTSLKG